MREVWKKIFCDTNLGWGSRKNKKKCYCFKKVTLKILKIFRKINRGGLVFFQKLLKKRKNSIKFYINFN